MRETSTASIALAAVLLTACGERPGRPHGDVGLAEEGPYAESEGGLDGLDGGQGPGMMGDDTCGPQESPLRRMSNVQYLNTLGDLFGDRDFSNVSTGLPADARSHGFENAAALQVPSPALIEGYYRAAYTVTQTLFGDLQAAEATIGRAIPMDRPSALDVGASVIEEHGRRMFRRPLSDVEIDRYVGIFEANFDDAGRPADDFVVGLASAFLAMLQSPHFVYIAERGDSEGEPGDLVRLTDYEVASRLSYLLWDSMPDEELFIAAEAGDLQTAAALEAQARRMLEAPRAQTSLRNFHRQWLQFDSLLDEMKDLPTYPAWSEDLLNAEYEQMGEFVDHVMFEGEGTIAALLTSTEFPVDARLAPLMGVEWQGEGWTTMALDPTQRRGFLTLPGWLAAHAHPVDPSPVLRGVAIRDQILCSPLPPPPDTVDATPPEPGEGAEPLTNRDRYVQLTSDSSCAACHTLIHGIGFPFEIYDSVGAFRTEDQDQPIDASGIILGFGEADGAVADALELIDRLATSEAVERCVTRQWFRYGFAREPDLEGSEVCAMDEFQAILHESGGNMRELLIAIVTSDTFGFRRIPGP